MVCFNVITCIFSNNSVVFSYGNPIKKVPPFSSIGRSRLSTSITGIFIWRIFQGAPTTRPHRLWHLSWRKNNENTFKQSIFFGTPHNTLTFFCTYVMVRWLLRKFRCIISIVLVWYHTVVILIKSVCLFSFLPVKEKPPASEWNITPSPFISSKFIKPWSNYQRDWRVAWWSYGASCFFLTW